MNQFKKCGIVMLPTNEKSKLILSFREKSFNHLTEPKLTLIEEANYQLSNIQSQHLYITSDDEIKEGDWCIKDYSMGQELVRYHKDYGNQCKKIIATTDSSLKLHTVEEYPLGASMDVYKNLPQPSQSFIEVFVREYNKGNIITDVLVEYASRCCGRCDNIHDYCISDTTCKTHNKLGCEICYGKSGYILKINPKDNTITIKKVKDSWNRGEVVDILLKLFRQRVKFPSHNSEEMEEYYNKWIEENL